MNMPQYVVSAKVCDHIMVKKKRKKVCDTITSAPMEKSMAHKIKKAAKSRVPHAKVRIHRA